MNDSVAFAVSSLVPRTIMYPLDNISVYQQAKSETFFNAVKYCKTKGLFAGYGCYFARTFFSQTVRWGIFGKMSSENGIIISSVVASTISSTLVQPLEVIRQHTLTGNTILYSRESLYKGNFRCILYANAYSLVELSTYSYLRKREINPFLIGPIVFFAVKIVCHPIETIMRMKIAGEDISLQYLYRGFCTATAKSIMSGFIHYSLYHHLTSDSLISVL